MSLVCVAGACSRSGKTALAVTLLQARPAEPALAVKFTTADDVFERCPRGTSCVVCDIDAPFRIVEDPTTLRQAGTDTARLLAAGARRVVWTIAKASHAAPAWRATQERLRGAKHVVIEGSTVVDLARPDALFFVAHPFLSPARWKATSGALVARADAVVVNRAAGEARPPSPDVLDALVRFRGRADVLIADVTRPLAEWAPQVAARLAA